MNFTRTQKWYIGIIALIVLLLVFSRSTPGQRTASSPASLGFVEPAVDFVLSDESFSEKSFAPSERVGGVAQLESATDGDDQEQRIIKQAELDLLVSSVEETQETLQNLAKNYDGFVRDASVYERNDKTMYGQAVLRVNVERFEEALTSIRDLALNVERERLTGTDVTEQFSDLEAQLSNAQAEEGAYLSLLRRAGSVSDLLEVQRELSNVRGKIERLEGRLTYLENQTDLATITVTLSEKPSLIAPTTDFRIGDTVKEAIQALIVTFQSILGGIVWIITFGIGVILPVGLILWGAYKLWKRRK